MAPSTPGGAASPSPSSSTTSAAHQRTPPTPSSSASGDDAFVRDLELEHPEPDVDVEWGSGSGGGASGDGIRLKTLGGARRGSDEYGNKEGEEEEEEEGEEKTFLPRRRDADVQDYELFTPDEEQAVVKRLDRRLVLFMGLLYMLSFLDRSNIGNAKIAGMSQDLSLSSNQYEWLLTAFYITYILFEWMTLMYRLIPPHIYIPLCVFSWGLLASLQSLSSSFTSLLILRALLGISEAAFGPGVPFYLSFFFRRDELAFRTGLFISAAPLSTSFASTLAWLITKLGEGGPWAPWRLLFLIEGFPSLFVAVWAWSFVPDSPGEARWLSKRQREVAVLRLRKESDGRNAGEKDDEGGRESGKRGMNLREVLNTLLDPKCYLTAFMFFSCNVAFSSVPVFLPTIIQEMGYTSLRSQALSAPPYLVAFALVLLTAHLSDRYRTRSVPLILHAALASCSFAAIALLGHASSHAPDHTPHPHTSPAHALRYLALYPATAGFFSAVTLIIAWTLNNQESASGRGAGMAVLNVVGQCGPLLGTRLFPEGEGPYYVRGMGTCAGFMGAVAVLAAGLRWVLVRENGRRVVEAEREGGDEGAVPLVGGGGRGRKREEGFLYML